MITFLSFDKCLLKHLLHFKLYLNSKQLPHTWSECSEYQGSGGFILAVFPKHGSSKYKEDISIEQPKSNSGLYLIFYIIDNFEIEEKFKIFLYTECTSYFWFRCKSRMSFKCRKIATISVIKLYQCMNFQLRVLNISILI